MKSVKNIIDELKQEINVSEDSEPKVQEKPKQNYEISEKIKLFDKKGEKQEKTKNPVVKSGKLKHMRPVEQNQKSAAKAPVIQKKDIKMAKNDVVVKIDKSQFRQNQMEQSKPNKMPKSSAAETIDASEEPEKPQELAPILKD